MCVICHRQSKMSCYEYYEFYFLFNFRPNTQRVLLCAHDARVKT